VNGVQALHPAGTRGRCSRYGELPAVNLVRVRWGSVAADGYRHKISNNNQLKQVLMDFWAQLSQDTLNQAIDQLPKRLVTKAKGGHVEFRLN